MNRPLLRKDLSGSQATLLMLKFVQLSPSSSEKACHVCIMWFLGSLRLSYQIACKLPFSSAAIQGMYWSFGAGAPSGVMLMNFAWLQVRPKFVDCWNEMSAPETRRLTLFW